MKQLLKYILSQLLEHQKIAETKHSVGIALAGGLAVIITSFITSTTVIVKIFAIISLVFCLLSLMFSFLAVSSKLISIKVKRKTNKSINYLYFEDIKNFTPKAFLGGIAKAYNFPAEYEPDVFEMDLAKTIIITSKRISSKYNLFNISTTFLIFSMVIMFVGGIFGGMGGILF